MKRYRAGYYDTGGLVGMAAIAVWSAVPITAAVVEGQPLFALLSLIGAAVFAVLWLIRARSGVDLGNGRVVVHRGVREIPLELETADAEFEFPQTSFFPGPVRVRRRGGRWQACTLLHSGQLVPSRRLRRFRIALEEAGVRTSDA